MIDKFTRPLGPFAVLYEQRVAPDSKQPPKKRGPRPAKQQQAVIAVETLAERKARHAADRQKQMSSILRRNPYSDVGRATDADKTGRIVGRRNEARSQ